MKQCQDLLPHLNRIDGQINALKKQLQSEADCQAIVQLALAASSSFKSFQAKLLEQYIAHELVTEPISAEKKANFTTMLKLAKS